LESWVTENLQGERENLRIPCNWSHAAKCLLHKLTEESPTAVAVASDLRQGRGRPPDVLMTNLQTSRMWEAREREEQSK